MSLRENLAVNLRRLRAMHGSIAAVCREMGVNRQQFDRYLSEDALPNRATTIRICKYFGIDEAELYRDPETADGLDHPTRPDRPPKAVAPTRYATSKYAHAGSISPEPTAPTPPSTATQLQ